MADDKVQNSAGKAEKAVIKRPGPSNKTLNKESQRPKSLAVADISMEDWKSKEDYEGAQAM